LIGVAVLPPVRWTPKLDSSSGAPSTRTSFQSTSSSSAMIIGRCIFVPCPPSGFLARMVTMPPGAMRMNAFGL
jgi:hypothetical protein